MPTKLKDLVITKVALVDEGACSAAHIKLFKKREGGSAMTFEDVLKSIPAEWQAVVTNHLNQQLNTVKKAKDDEIAAKDEKIKTAEAELTKAQQELETAKDELEKATSVEKGKPSEEEILKGLDPVVRDMITKARAQEQAAITALKKMKEQQEHEEAVAKAKTMPNIGLEEDKFANVIKGLNALDETTRNDVMKAFEMANEAIAKGGVLNEIGKSAGNGGEGASSTDEAWAQIEKKAQEIRKSTNCSLEAATTRAINENPDLYSQYLDAHK